MSRRQRIRIAYLAMAGVAFCLALAAGDLFFIATSGFTLFACLGGAAIGRRQERRDTS